MNKNWNRTARGMGSGKCLHIQNGTCKHPDRSGGSRCAKNKCCDFKDPKDPKNKK